MTTRWIYRMPFILVAVLLIPKAYSQSFFFHTLGNEPLVSSNPQATFVSSVCQTPDTSSYTFNSTAFGAASSDRRLLIAVSAVASTTRSITSVDVDGTTANFINGGVTILGSNNLIGAYYYVNSSSGTSGTVTINFSGTMIGTCLTVWNMTGVNSMVPVDFVSAFGSDPVSQSINIPSGNSLAIATSGSFGSATTTWGGATKAFDTDGTGFMISGAKANFSSAASGYIISADVDGSVNTYNGAFIAVFQ